MRRLDRMLLSAVLTAVVACAAAPAASAAGPCSMGDTPVSELSEFGAQFVTLCLINEQRARAGVGSLRFNAKLYLAGYDYASEMDAGHFFAHQTPDGGNVASRVAAQDYAVAGDATQLGENLAWGNTTNATPAATIRAWLASPGHRSTMLDPAFREVGVGVHLGAPVTGAPAGESATYAAVFGSITADPARARARARSHARARAAACRKAARRHQRRSARCSRLRF